MKTIVNDGAGFIGSAVFRHIIRNTDDRVINLDRLIYASKVESLAAVMHLAAESDVDCAIDASTIQRQFGWVFEENFESGIRKTVEWHMDNLGWCRRVQAAPTSANASATP